MKTSGALKILVLSVLTECNDSLNFFGITPGKIHCRHHFGLYEKTAASVPHPPDNPPPDAILDKDVYFAAPAAPSQSDEDEKQDSQASAVNGNYVVNGGSSQKEKREGEYEPLRIEIDDETKKISRAAAQKFFETVIKPIAEVQRGVPGEAIKGAALVGAALGVLTTKGVVVSSAASLSAAYVAISQGVLGDVFRTVGGITWDITEAAAILYQKATANEKSAGMSKELADKVMAAVSTSPSYADKVKAAEKVIATEFINENEEEFEPSETELARVLKEAESAINAADAAIAAADETLGTDDQDTSELEQEAAKLEEEARIAEEEARIAEEEARRITEENRKAAEEERLRIEAEKERLAEEARLEEERKLREELLAAQEQVRLEEEKITAENAPDSEAGPSEIYDQEWDMIALAQEGLGGKIVGIDDAISDEKAKKEWDAAGALAQELQDGPYDEFDEGFEEYEVAETEDKAVVDEDFVVDDEIDMKAIGAAARQAVEIYEQQNEAKNIAKQELRSAWADQMVVDEAGKTDEEYEDYDYEDYDYEDLDVAEDLVSNTDVDIAAREAVETGSSAEVIDGNDGKDNFEFFEDDNRVPLDQEHPPAPSNWSALTVAKLKEELKARGLKSYGKKAELVKLLEEYEADRTKITFEDAEEKAHDTADAFTGVEDGGSEDWFDHFGKDLDIEELGKQARAAVDASFADEPSDEILKQLESEEPLLFQEEDPKTSDFYESMTVAQLKDVLRSKGLRVSGRKAELIERLRSS